MKLNPRKTEAIQSFHQESSTTPFSKILNVHLCCDIWSDRSENLKMNVCLKEVLCSSSFQVQSHNVFFMLASFWEHVHYLRKARVWRKLCVFFNTHHSLCQCSCKYSFTGLVIPEHHVLWHTWHYKIGEDFSSFQLL